MTARELSAADAAALVRPTDTMAIPLGPGAPGRSCTRSATRDDWETARGVRRAAARPLRGLHEAGRALPQRLLRSGRARCCVDAGADIEFVPADFRRFVTLAEQFAPRVMTTTAARRPTRNGFMSLSLHAGATVGELHRAAADPDRIVIVEVERAVAAHDRASRRSSPHSLHVDEVDVIVAQRRRAVRARRRRADRRRPRDRRARARVHHRRLHAADRHRRHPVDGRRRCSPSGTGGDYGVHSEMFTTGLMQLHQAGKVTNARKGEFDGFSITTFALGTAELYAWLDGNADVRFLPVDVVNAPHTIARNHRHGVDQRRARGRPLRPGRRRSPRRPPVLGHRRPRGLRRAVGPRARGPLADLPAVDRDASTARRCRGSCRRCRRARRSRRRATRSTS